MQYTTNLQLEVEAESQTFLYSFKYWIFIMYWGSIFKT